jgi:hypothetical protein
MEMRQKELAELQDKALYALEHVNSPGWRMWMRFQLWTYPSFGNYKSWSVFTDSQNANTAVREVTWDNTSDGFRFTNPLEGLKKGWHTAPTILIKDAPLNKEELDSRLQFARAISTPVFANGGIGMDGTSYGFQMPIGSSGIRLKWWEEGPKEWSELTTWAADMRVFLVEAIEKHHESKHDNH